MLNFNLFVNYNITTIITIIDKLKLKLTANA